MARRSPHRSVEGVLIVVAHAFILAGVGLIVTDTREFFAGNLILLGGIVLVVGITGYLFGEKRRRRFER